MYIQVIGADIQHVDEDARADGVFDGLVHKKNMRWIVTIYVLTEPSAGTSESGTSSLEVCIHVDIYIYIYIYIYI